MCFLIDSIDWFQAIQTISSCLTVIAAFFAIKTWKYQSKAKIESDFLDELMHSVQEHIQAISKPCDFLKLAHIGFSSYQSTIGTINDSFEQGVIAFIKAKGESEAKRMWESLEVSSKHTAKIKALIAKGQVYGFFGYEECVSAVKMLIWQHDRLQVVATMLDGANLSWESPEVKGMLANMLSVTPESIVMHQNDNMIKLLDFVRVTYKRIYAGA